MARPKNVLHYASNFYLPVLLTLADSLSDNKIAVLQSALVFLRAYSAANFDVFLFSFGVHYSCDAGQRYDESVRNISAAFLQAILVLTSL